MSEKDLDHAVERLITAANEEGGVDNISCVLARIEAA
jgi:serine/threonine protein phosphatase PrpC